MCERVVALKSGRKWGLHEFRSWEVGWWVSAVRKLGTWIGGS